MRVSVIFEDRAIVIDGVAAIVAPADFPAFDANWTALQWYGAAGTIEVRAGDRIWIDEADFLAPYLAAHAAKLAADEVARLAALAAGGGQ